MRILLDECLPVRLRRELSGHQVRTVRQMGWLGVKNGLLLRRVAESNEFDVFLTVDKNLPRQHRIGDLPFGVVVLRTKSNRFEDAQPLMPELRRRLPESQAGKVLFVALPG